jgi:hypothetical protein
MESRASSKSLVPSRQVLEMLLQDSNRRLLKRTMSRCPECHAACAAEVWRVEGAAGEPAQVFLKRTCPEHGEISVCLASDARFYWLAQGNPENANGGGGCCAGAKGEGESAGVACCASDGSEAGTLGRNAAGHGEGGFESLASIRATWLVRRAMRIRLLQRGPRRQPCLSRNFSSASWG